jgi:hypothetical protein
MEEVQGGGGGGGGAHCRSVNFSILVQMQNF